MVTEREKKVLDLLFENRHFYQNYLSEVNWDEAFGEDFVKYLENEHGIEFETGVTKLVVIPENENFVLKIPFDGTGYQEGFRFFYGAQDGDAGRDYCKAEALFYEEAKKWGLEFLFAETIQIAEAWGVPIYRQPRCDIFEFEFLHETTKETLTAVEEACDTCDYNCFNEDWLVEVVLQYGEDVLHDLLSFLRHEHITDLHDKNIGFLNGKPILFDYASFDD